MLGTESWYKSGTGSLATNYDASRCSVSKRAMVLTATSTSAVYAYTPRFEVNSGETYTISGWVYMNNYCKSVSVGIFSSTSKTAEYPYQYKDSSYNYYIYPLNSYSTKGSWHYFEETITLKSGVKSAYVRLTNAGTSNSSYSAVAYFSDLMITKGNKAVGWNVSSKDAQAQIEENSTSISQTAYEVGLKLNSSKFTSAGILGLINNRDGTSTAKIAATNVDLSGYVTISGLSGGTTTINGSCIKTGTISASHLDTSTINAKSGTIGGINISSGGMYYSGSSTTDGFGFWAPNIHRAYTPAGVYSAVIFHVGGNNANIGGAAFRVYQNGCVYAQQLYTMDNYIFTKTKSVASLEISANGSTAWVQIAGFGTDAYGLTFNRSDEKLKKNIKKSKVDALSIVNQMKLIEFDWKEDGRHEAIGYGAKQLQKLDKDLVYAVRQPKKAKHRKILQINAFKIDQYLTGAVQQLSKKMDKLEKMVEEVCK